MDEQKLVFTAVLVLSVCLAVAVGQCPGKSVGLRILTHAGLVNFYCPAGQICAMARQDYGPAIPECINSGGLEATLLDQAMQRGPAGPGTGTGRHIHNRYGGGSTGPGTDTVRHIHNRYGGESAIPGTGSHIHNRYGGVQLHSGLYGRPYQGRPYRGRPYRGFQDPYAVNMWDPMSGGSRYPVDRYMSPFDFRRPVQTYGGHVPLVNPGSQGIGFRPNFGKAASEPIRINATVDDGNHNDLGQNGSANVEVKQEAKHSATPTPHVNHGVPVSPIHLGPLVPVQIHDLHDVHDPGHRENIPIPVVDPPVLPIEEKGNQGSNTGSLQTTCRRCEKKEECSSGQYCYFSNECAMQICQPL